MIDKKNKLKEVEKIDSIVEELERIISQIRALPLDVAQDFLKYNQQVRPDRNHIKTVPVKGKNNIS